MTNDSPGGFSSADHPYSIASSEAQWWMRAAKLAILRLRDDAEDLRVGFGSRQIDARQLVIALNQLLVAAQMEHDALTEVGLGATVGSELLAARERFKRALPGIKDMRDGLIHFEDWSRGRGRFGPQRADCENGVTEREVARRYRGFGYDPRAGTVSFGPYVIAIEAADNAAAELASATYLAARAVDRREMEALHERVVAALDRAGLRHDAPDATVQVVLGRDLRIWLAMRLDASTSSAVIAAHAERAVAVLSAVGLSLEVPAEPDTPDVVEHLVRGVGLHVCERPVIAGVVVGTP